jgi:DNA-binding NarL/FixJ family response regulator
MNICIAIVDDNIELTKSIIQNLSMFEEIEIVFTACNGEDFFNKFIDAPKKPIVILKDIDMPVMNGIETTALIRELYPETKIIILTVFDDDDKIFEAIHAGANGYLLKDAKPKKIFSAIEDVLDGGVPMSPSVAIRTLDLLLNFIPPTKNIKTPKDYELSEREIEVLKLLATGKNYNLIAEVLFLSPKTIRGHLERIYKKLHVHTKLEAVQLAQKHRWIKPTNS